MQTGRMTAGQAAGETQCEPHREVYRGHRAESVRLSGVLHLVMVNWVSDLDVAKSGWFTPHRLSYR